MCDVVLWLKCHTGERVQTSGFSCLKSYYINSLLFVIPVTMACKCHVERGSRECIGYWNEHFTAVSG